MNFQKHTSREMVELFNKKPFQGQSPEAARIVFLSSDANYSPEISNHPFFKYILEYHKDSIAFWKKYGCHHPFLLPNYPFNRSTGGVPFHRNFSKIGLGPEYAEHICFLELLDVPTIGNRSKDRKLFYELVSEAHLAYIEKLMLGGGEKLFFVSNGVLREIAVFKKRYPLFQWLDYRVSAPKQYSRTINGNRIEEIYHFSSAQIHSQVSEIYSLINQWLGYDIIGE